MNTKRTVTITFSEKHDLGIINLFGFSKLEIAYLVSSAITDLSVYELHKRERLAGKKIIEISIIDEKELLVKSSENENETVLLLANYLGYILNHM